MFVFALACSFKTRSNNIVQSAFKFSQNTNKQNGEPGILSHVSDVRITKNGRKGLIVCLIVRSALGLRIGRRAKILGNSAHVSSKEVTVMYTKC